MLNLVSAVIIISFNNGNIKGIDSYPYSIAACIYCCLLLVYFLPVTVLQLYLSLRNLNYQEFFEGVWNTDSDNPFIRPLYYRIIQIFDPLP